MTEFFKHFAGEFTLPLRDPILIFSLILSIILLSPIVLRRLNIPGIIGLIISGVIIGPHGLNLLAKNLAVDLFSTIGLLYIMFIAGLELNLAEFKANRNKSLVFGLFTFLLPLSIGFPVCYYLLGYDVNASLLTASMFATHTLVAYPIVSRLGISKDQAVAVTVGGTILTDTAVLILLAVIMANHAGQLDQEFWITLSAALAIFSLIMFVVIPRIAKWFFSKLQSEKHSHFIFVLSVVFFSAFLAKAAGIEPIIGAFVAGLALNKLIPHSSALMNRIEFIGNSLFIPFFLISVGMVVDFKVVMNGTSALVIAGTLTIVALLGKWVAAFVTQKVFGYSMAQRDLIFGLSSSHAAATLAVILVGYNAGILDENILNGTIILILITCVVATFTTEKAAKRIVIDSESDVIGDAGPATYSSDHILLPVTDISDMEGRLELAILMKDKQNPDPVLVLTVVSDDSEAERNLVQARSKLEGFVKQGSASETSVNVMTTIDHNPISGIARISREIMADLILLGWPRPTSIVDRFIGERLDTLLGSTDKTIITSHLVRPLALHKNVVVIAPPMAEREKGFASWLTKVARLSVELSQPLVVYADKDTAAAVKDLLDRSKVNPSLEMELFDDWDHFLALARYIDDEDLIVLVSARKGAASYIPVLDQLPAKLERYFAQNSRLVIYPQQFTDGNGIDFSMDPLNKGIETIGQIGKGIGGIFQKK